MEFAHKDVCGEFPHPSSGDFSPYVHTKNDMKFLTYNIHFWAGMDGRPNLDRVEEIIRQSKADVIGLNEVLHPWISPTGPQYPLPELARRLNMFWIFGFSFEQHQGRGFWAGFLGNALLSRYPVSSWQNYKLPGWKNRKQRNLLQARLDTPYGPVVAMTTHLDHLLEPVRRRQLEGIKEQLLQVKGPHILMGDFNIHEPVHSSFYKIVPTVIKRLRAFGYTDSFATVGKGKGLSYKIGRPRLRIDFMWVPNAYADGLRNAKVVNCDVSWLASDHQPVWIQWTPPQADIHVGMCSEREQKRHANMAAYPTSAAQGHQAG